MIKFIHRLHFYVLLRPYLINKEGPQKPYMWITLLSVVPPHKNAHH